MALNEKNEREFKVLTEREHVLERPAMYIGGIDCVEREMWMFDGDSGKFEYKTVMYNAGAIKCFSEILDNCLDAAIDGQFKTLSKIKVEINGRKITVEDNGPGIPVEVADGDSKGRTKPELAWCQARAGTSFNENRAGMGANGLGSTCTNIFSTKFEGTSDDGKHRQTIKCKDNMAEINPGRITESRRHGVCVEFELDYARFGLPETGFDDIHKTIIYQRMLVLSMMYPKISFSYNGKKIEIDDKKFPAMFSDNALSYKSDNTWILVFENEYDSFHAFTYVNGLEMPRGGTHVNHVSDSISYAARDLLVKKFKTIRPGDIKNKICVAVLMTNFSNPEFDAQNKEQLTNAVPAITKHLNGKFDFNKIAKDLIKTPEIADPIIETFKLKEEVKDRVALKQSLKSKPKIDADKYIPPTGRNRKYMFLCEGLSALGGISQALGRDGIAYYAGRGVPLNVWKANSAAMNKNKEFTDIMSILGLDPTKTGMSQSCAFEKIVHANDADCFAGDTLVVVGKGMSEEERRALVSSANELGISESELSSAKLRDYKRIDKLTYDDEVLCGDGKFRHPSMIQEKIAHEWIEICIGGEEHEVKRVEETYYHSSSTRTYLGTDYECSFSFEVTPNQKLFVVRDGEEIEILARELMTTDMFRGETHDRRIKSARYFKDGELLGGVECAGDENQPSARVFYDITLPEDHSFFIHLIDKNAKRMPEVYKYPIEETIRVHNCDGIHICEIYMGWWMKLCPELFNQKRICRLMTPLAVLYSDASKKKALKYFFTLDEYKTYEQSNPEKVRRGKVCYYKGLGSWSKDDFQKLFASSPNGLEDFLQPIVLKDKSGDTEILDDWLSDAKSDKRKDYLRKYNLDINQI